MKKTVKIRNLTLGEGRPKICVPLVANDEEQLREQLLQIEQVPYDLAEFRADHYHDIEDLQTMRQALSAIRETIKEKPLLFTFRTQAEGGARSISNDAYLRLNLMAAGLAAENLTDMVDVELFTLVSEEQAPKELMLEEQIQEPLTPEEILPEKKIPEKIISEAWEPRTYIQTLHSKGVKVIGSSHDFTKTPDTPEMIRRLTNMQKLDMDITKLAVMPRSRQDVVRLLEAAVLMEEKYGDRPCVTMSMGESGSVSRLIGSFTGSAITFGTAGRSSAPGQFSASKLVNILDLLEN